MAEALLQVLQHHTPWALSLPMQPDLYQLPFAIELTPWTLVGDLEQ